MRAPCRRVPVSARASVGRASPLQRLWTWTRSKITLFGRDLRILRSGSARRSNRNLWRRQSNARFCLCCRCGGRSVAGHGTSDVGRARFQYLHRPAHLRAGTGASRRDTRRRRPGNPLPTGARRRSQTFLRGSDRREAGARAGRTYPTHHRARGDRGLAAGNRTDNDSRGVLCSPSKMAFGCRRRITKRSSEAEAGMTKDELDFSLANTRCVHGHWEDPDRGERSTDQLMLSRGVQILASHAAIPEKCVPVSASAFAAAKKSRSTFDRGCILIRRRSPEAGRATVMERPTLRSRRDRCRTGASFAIKTKPPNGTPAFVLMVNEDGAFRPAAV